VPKTSDLAPLDAVGWLAQQPPAFRHWAAGAGWWQRYQGGQVLYDAGDPSDGLYGLAQGALDITFPLVADEPVTLHRGEIGFWIGDSGLLAHEPRAVSIHAAAPSRAFFIPGEAVRALLAEQPERWRAFYLLSHLNAVTVVNLLAEVLALSVSARVARRLLRLADPDDVVNVTQDDLAKLVGVARATLQRAFNELTKANALRTAYRSVTIANRKVLERYVNQQ
jgi:CRP/FNR family transcriptional regulator, cyclic AMP receptor protein